MNKIKKEIKKLENDFILLKKELKNSNIIKTKSNIYIKEDKEIFLILWKKYINYFRKLQKLINKHKYRRYLFFIDYNNIVIRRNLLIIYFESLVDTLKGFGKHETFIRIFLEDNFKYDYGKVARYIYRPNFINLINTPSIFISIHKNKINKSIQSMIEKEKQDIGNSKIIMTDYKNIYFYIRNRFFKVMYFISKYMGRIISRTKFSTRKSGLITNKNIKKYLQIAKPGDIFLTRGNWNASNISIPGFWKHMSMYIGKGGFLKNHFSYSFIKSLDDNEEYIIEATGKGIEIKSINELLKRNDYLGVSRTNFKKEKIIRTINNSFKNIGKGYDFIFNFNSDRSLVCSELILKSYSKEFKGDTGIKIDLENIGISLTYPPNKFISEIFRKGSNLEPIFFIDSIEKTGKNFINTDNELKKSKKRSRFSFLIK